MPPPNFVQTSLYTPMNQKMTHWLESPLASFLFEPHHQLLDNSHDWDVPHPMPSLNLWLGPEASTHQLSPVPESPAVLTTTATDTPLQLQPEGLPISPTDRSAEIPCRAEIPPAILTADFPMEEDQSVVGAMHSIPLDAPPLPAGTPPVEAEFPTAPGGPTDGIGADILAEFLVKFLSTLHPSPLTQTALPLTSTPVCEVGAHAGWVSPTIPSSTTPIGSPPIPTLLDISVPSMVNHPAPPISPIGSPSTQFGTSKPVLTFGAEGQLVGQLNITMDDA
ncbi:hypothetical protein JAAARDRAFT_200517 [Jaapia argillacea MUCL 33604]|uniref:Uncharacterized protein n=1 Tax=Jaapia argillacea MUCL 33604 TaxID=933084 RepID=A0A067P4I1_9AGAM|nr:hypothetical protein JAAARDRAFT_200517 [Jaapia argillacea MUCL 33604]